MTASYFRALATRCRNAACECFDLCAKEEFRRLAGEFATKADELDGGATQSSLPRWWSTAKPSQFVGR
jgi:hypothetical protein